MSAMPIITLDRTLHSLYSLDDDENKDIILAYATPLADITLSEGIPAPVKYAYQSPLIPSNDKDYLAREFLHLLPQLFAFIAGKMSVVLFNLDEGHTMNGNLAPSQPQYHKDALGVYAKLAPEQRPELVFVSRPVDVKFNDSTKFAIINPMDCFDDLPQLCSAEGHYQLLSKTHLARSGLPTPSTTVVETKHSIHELADPSIVNSEVDRFISAIKARHTPFIVKLPQSLAGQGTFIIRTEGERTSALSILQPEIRRMLQKVTAENAHLSPAGLALQEMVPGEAVALSLFITKKGRAVYNACCHQLIDNEGKWSGNYIDYRVQDELEAKYAAISDRLAKYTRASGYWGPFGADIMTDAQGQQLVIDMNVRVIGSHPMGALRNFFQARALNVAICFFPVLVAVTKPEFENKFKDELESGELVICGWVHAKDGKTSMATMVLAGKEKESLEPMIKRVNALRIEIPDAP